MNIVPKFHDILSDQTSQFLRRNITNGAYNDVYHYLDVQFRLLREDFLKPLRDGVLEFREIIRQARLNNPQPPKNISSHSSATESSTEMNLLTGQVKSRLCKIESLSVYFECSLEGPVITDGGIAYHVRLSEEKIKSLGHDSASRKLMYGSLICMSNDYFKKNCLIGSICDRDADMFKKGIVTVKFNVNEDENDDLMGTTAASSAVGSRGRFIMLETSAFFESYKHVLKALVSFRRDAHEDFPFRENLVHCQNRSIPMPKYLASQQYIDLRYARRLFLIDRMIISKLKKSL